MERCGLVLQLVLFLEAFNKILLHLLHKIPVCLRGMENFGGILNEGKFSMDFMILKIHVHLRTDEFPIFLLPEGHRRLKLLARLTGWGFQACGALGVRVQA